MKQAELKKVVKFIVSDTARVCELKSIREFIKLAKTDVDCILADTCKMLEREGIKRNFYISEYADAHITFYDNSSGIVTVIAYGHGDTDTAIHKYVIYASVRGDLSISNSALLSIDGISSSI